MWVDEFRPDRKRFIIQTEIKRICFGSPGFVMEWVTHSSYDTAEERDRELTRLRRADPMKGRYRAHDYSPWENRRVAF